MWARTEDPLISSNRCCYDDTLTVRQGSSICANGRSVELLLLGATWHGIFGHIANLSGHLVAAWAWRVYSGTFTDLRALARSETETWSRRLKSLALVDVRAGARYAELGQLWLQFNSH